MFCCRHSEQCATFGWICETHFFGTFSPVSYVFLNSPHYPPPTISKLRIATIQDNYNPFPAPPPPSTLLPLRLGNQWAASAGETGLPRHKSHTHTILHPVSLLLFYPLFYTPLPSFSSSCPPPTFSCAPLASLLIPSYHRGAAASSFPLILASFCRSTSLCFYVPLGAFPLTLELQIEKKKMNENASISGKRKKKKQRPRIAEKFSCTRRVAKRVFCKTAVENAVSHTVHVTRRVPITQLFPVKWTSKGVQPS